MNDTTVGGDGQAELMRENAVENFGSGITFVERLAYREPAGACWFARRRFLLPSWALAKAGASFLD
jgi:hypothetical protein